MSWDVQWPVSCLSMCVLGPVARCRWVVDEPVARSGWELLRGGCSQREAATAIVPAIATGICGDVVADPEQHVRERDDVELHRPVVDRSSPLPSPFASCHENQACRVSRGGTALVELHEPQPESEPRHGRKRDGLAPPRRRQGLYAVG